MNQGYLNLSGDLALSLNRTLSLATKVIKLRSSYGCTNANVKDELQCIDMKSAKYGNILFV